MKLSTYPKRLMMSGLAIFAVLSVACSPLSLPNALGPAGDDSGKVEITGTVQELEPTTLKVEDHTIRVEAQSEIEADIQVGDTIKVQARVQEDGSLVVVTARHSDDDANANGNDDNGNDDNGNANGNDDNGNDDNANGNDDNGNANGNDDNGNDDNSNANGNDDNGNDDNGNGNGNDDNANINNNDNGNGNDDNGNANGNDDNGNDDNGNDDNSGSGGGDDDNSGKGKGGSDDDD
jgi:hypothetical protein